VFSWLPFLFVVAFAQPGLSYEAGRLFK